MSAKLLLIVENVNHKRTKEYQKRTKGYNYCRFALQK